MSTGHSLATTRLLSPPDSGTLVLKLGWTLTQPFYHTLPLLCQPPDPRDPYCLVSSLPHSKASMGKVFEKKGKPKGPMCLDLQPPVACPDLATPLTPRT